MDKTILQLPLIDQQNIAGNCRLPLARAAAAATEGIELTQLINFIALNLSGAFKLLTIGAANPDNVNGTNGDTYIKSVTGALTFYQKVEGQWLNRGTIALGMPKKRLTIADIPDGI